jgi:hypothetical protein
MISEKRYIQVIPELVGKDDCEVCAQCDVDYVDEEKGLILRFGYTEARRFYGGFGNLNFIEDLIDNKKKLDKSVTSDPGFEWNQFYEGLIKDTDVLEKYHFVGNSHKQIRPYYNSWFYNDEDGNIIFEITPFYSFHYETKKSHPDFITYKKFMKDYKVTVRIVIPKERLIQWNNQAKSYNPVCYDSKGKIL